jgi:hypothetical protein
MLRSAREVRPERHRLSNFRLPFGRWSSGLAEGSALVVVPLVDAYCPPVRKAPMMSGIRLMTLSLT